jgi:hypothetical protein
MLEILSLAGFLLWCKLSLPLARWLEFLLFDGGMGTTVGSAASLCTVVGKPSSTCRVEDCHSVEVLGFSWTREMGLSCREVECEALGFCAPWESRSLLLTADYQVTAFLPSVGNLASCSLMAEWGLSCCQAQWGVLGLCAPWKARLLAAVE